MSMIGGDEAGLRDAARVLSSRAVAAEDVDAWFRSAVVLSGLGADGGWAASIATAGEEIDRLANTSRQTGELLVAVADGLTDLSWGSPFALFEIGRELVDVELAAMGVEPDEERALDAQVAANRLAIRADLDTETDPSRRALLQSWLDPFVDPVTGDVTVPQVLVYDAGADRVAIAFGDVTTADDVVVAVPGTGTTPEAYRLGEVKGGEARRAELLRQRIDREGATQSAVIAWLGYDAPQWIDTNNPATSGAGEEGGLLLHGFVDGLGLSDGQRLSVIGHSYGSFVVGEALSDGLAPDNTIVLGSPGMGVDHVGDFGLPEGSDVFAMRAPMDPVGSLSRFGTAPTLTIFGAERLRAHTDTVAFSHSDYWDDENRTQIARAVTDGSPELARISSAGDLVDELVLTPVAVADDIVDQVQRPLPGFLEDDVDALQTVVRSTAGAVSAVASHAVDMSVNALDELGDAVGAGVQWSGERLGDGIEWTGDRIDDGVGWAGDRVADVADSLGDAVTFWD